MLVLHTVIVAYVWYWYGYGKGYICRKGRREASKDDGGPAFPQSYRVPGDSRIVECSGMSMHGLYAALAMYALIGDKDSSTRTDADGDACWCYDHVAAQALRFADAMIEEKRRRE
jgi:hypothetical protein